MTLGTYPEVSLEAARREAGGLQVALTSGGDPAVTRSLAARAVDAAAARTFGAAAEAFMSGGMPVRKGKKPSPRYAAETRRNLDNHVLPRWRDRPIGSITRADVRTLVMAVASGEVPARAGERTAAKGGPIAANRVLSALSALFGWAVRQDLVQANPCALVEKPGEEKKRSRVLSDPEIADAWAAMDALGYPFGTFMQLALLLGQRRTEVAQMRWADLDMDASVWMNLTRLRHQGHQQHQRRRHHPRHAYDPGTDAEDAAQPSGSAAHPGPEAGRAAASPQGRAACVDVRPRGRHTGTYARPRRSDLRRSPRRCECWPASPRTLVTASSLRLRCPGHASPLSIPTTRARCSRRRP